MSADPTNSEQVEAVDHRGEAERRISQAETLMVGSGPPCSDRHNTESMPVAAQVAQAHATLALVDEVAKLREAVERSAIPPTQILGRADTPLKEGPPRG